MTSQRTFDQDRLSSSVFGSFIFLNFSYFALFMGKGKEIEKVNQINTISYLQIEKKKSNAIRLFFSVH